VGGVAALLLMIERAKNRPVRKLPPFALSGALSSH